MLTAASTPANVTTVTAKSVAGFGDPINSRRTSAHRDTGAFFMPDHRDYGGCAWETSGSAGFLESRFANLRTATPILFGDSGDGSSTLGATPMQFPTRNPSARAAAHRAMARAALFSDSSTRTRLKRYNHHMSKARAFDAAAGAGGAA